MSLIFCWLIERDTIRWQQKTKLFRSKVAAKKFSPKIHFGPKSRKHKVLNIKIGKNFNALYFLNNFLSPNCFFLNLFIHNFIYSYEIRKLFNGRKLWILLTSTHSLIVSFIEKVFHCKFVTDSSLIFHWLKETQLAESKPKIKLFRCKVAAKKLSMKSHKVSGNEMKYLQLKAREKSLKFQFGPKSWKHRVLNYFWNLRFTFRTISWDKIFFFILSVHNFICGAEIRKFCQKKNWEFCD